MVDDQKANSLGPNIGIKQVHEKPQCKQVVNITEEDKSHPEKTLEFVKIGEAKNHVMKSQFLLDVTPIQQKVRHFPIHLQERVENEFNKLIDQKHNLKLENCSDKQFISPIVKTVKKDQTVKLALDSKNLKIHSQTQVSDAEHQIFTG